MLIYCPQGAKLFEKAHRRGQTVINKLRCSVCVRLGWGRHQGMKYNRIKIGKQ